MTALIVIEGVVIILLALLVAGLLKSHAEILRQLDALGVSEDGSVPARASQGTPRTTGLDKAPETTLTGVDTSGGDVVVSLEHGRGNTLLAFLSSGCLSCETFWREFSGDFDLPTPDTRTVIVTKGPESESPAKVRDLAPPRLPLLMSNQVWDAFSVPMTPYFLLVDRNGLIVGEGAAASWRHLLGLLRQSAADADGLAPPDNQARLPSDEDLRDAGVHPGDPSLYEKPVNRE